MEQFIIFIAELRKLEDSAEKAKRPLVMGADVNAHHTVWGSSDTNDRDEEQTYIGPSSKNVLGVTLQTNQSRVKIGRRFGYTRFLNIVQKS